MQDPDHTFRPISQKDCSAVRGENREGLIRLMGEEAICALELCRFPKRRNNDDAMSMHLLRRRHRGRPSAPLEQALQSTERPGITLAAVRCK